jgi:uncharacterized cupredoxin-like copper-binding protein
MRRSTFLLLLPVLGLVVSACAAGGADSEPRNIRVAMADDMSYDPASFDFAAGETVTFEVSNDGAVRHEFFIGTLEDQQHHAEEMQEGAHADGDEHADPTALSVEPGASGTLTYTFDEAGELLVGCHEPGHYEAGMVAPVTVTP